VKLERKIRELYANIGKLITSSLDLSEILEGIMQEVKNFFQPQNWSLLRVDQNTNELFFLIFQGKIDKSKVQDIRLKVGEGIAGSVVATGNPIYVANTDNDPRFSRRVDDSTGFKTQSIIAVPMRFRDTIYGVIEIVNGPGGSFFTEDEHLVLQTLADFSAIAFANAAMYETMIDALHHDPLTHGYNRSKLDDVIEEHESDAKRRDFEHPFVTVIVIDLNNFKEINDNFGHLAGDKVLKQTAHALRKCVRKEDMVFRIGGDEFLLLLTSPDPEKVRYAQERVENELNTIAAEGAHDTALAFSYGVASGDIARIRSLIEEADQNMYKAKKEDKGGRQGFESSPTA